MKTLSHLMDGIYLPDFLVVLVVCLGYVLVAVIGE